MHICWCCRAHVEAPGQHSYVCQRTLFFTPLTDVALPSRSLCWPHSALHVWNVLWEPQVFFTQDKKAEEEAETMASCFPLRTVLFSRFILFVFLSPHLSNVSVRPAISQGKRGELRKRKVCSHLTHSTTRQPSTCASNSVLTKKHPSLEWAMGRRTLPTAVLQPCHGTVHPCCLPGWALGQTHLSLSLWTFIHVSITGGSMRGGRNPNSCALPLLSVLCTWYPFQLLELEERKKKITRNKQV